MNPIISTVLPVFGLICLGFACAKTRVIGVDAGRGITLFVFNIAIPAFLFRTVATMVEPQSSPWWLWLVYFGAIAVVWIATAFVSRFFESLDISGGAAASMAASFGNLALLGTPLAVAHFGEAAAVPVGLILSIHAAVLWFTATVHRELAHHSGTLSIPDLLRQLAIQLSTNSIVLALVAAALWRLTGLGIHPVPDRMLSLLSDAGVPTALVALGVSLAGYTLRSNWSGMTALIVLKMVLLPLVVFLFARYLFPLPPLWTKIAVLLASMPTGANAFLFAQKNDEAVAAVSGAIALGTILAAATASLVLWLSDTNLI